MDGVDWDTFNSLPATLTLDLKTGKIKNWKYGAFNLNLKMVDRGYYKIYTPYCYYEVFNEYVPEALAVSMAGWGDYIRLDISSDGSVIGFDKRKAQEELNFYINDLKRKSR